MPDLVSEGIAQVRHLRNVGKIHEALQILNNLEERGILSSKENLTCLIFKGDIYYRLGRFNDGIKIAEQAYKEGQRLGDLIRSIDALLIKQWCLSSLGRPDEAMDAVKQGENLLKEFKGEPSVKITNREGELVFAKSNIQLAKNELDKALECAMESLTLRKKVKSKIGITLSLNIIGSIYQSKGNLEQGLEYFEKGLKLAKEINFASQIQLTTSNIGVLYRFKGEYNLALQYLEEGLVLAKELGNKQQIGMMLIWIADIYRIKGELEQALNYFEENLALAEEMGYQFQIASNMGELGAIYYLQGNNKRGLEYYKKSLEIAENIENMFLISLVIGGIIHFLTEEGDIKQAQQYLGKLAEHKEDRFVFYCYRFSKAEILKQSTRVRDWIEAESLLKQLLEDEIPWKDTIASPLSILCELYLMELKENNDLEIIDEINPIISSLLKKGEDDHSYLLLAETNLLRAKLALIQMNMGDARRFLTQAQRMADEHGLQLLARKISSEHDLLLDQLDKWDNLKQTNAPMSERIELASIDGVIDRMQQKHALDPPKLETEQSILIAILSKTGYMVFSNPFTADMTFDEKRLGDFISTLRSSSDHLFSEAIDRIKIGDYIVLLKIVGDFSICYVFRGQSYSAGQKLNNFSEAVKENNSIIEVFNIAVRTGQQIKINENTDLEELITNSFMADPTKFQLPFKAYKGDDLFLFVSYAHSDKLQVYPIMDYLNKSGFNVWYDEGISVSDDWKKSIVDNIESCKAFLVFITPHIIDSKFVRREISFALSRDKPFYAIYLKDTKLPSELEFEIAGIQSMKKYTMPDSEFYSKIKEVLSSVFSIQK